MVNYSALHRNAHHSDATLHHDMQHESSWKPCRHPVSADTAVSAPTNSKLEAYCSGTGVPQNAALPRHCVGDAEFWRAPSEEDGLWAAPVAHVSDPSTQTPVPHVPAARMGCPQPVAGLCRPVASGGTTESQTESAQAGDQLPAHRADLFRPISVEEALSLLNADHPTRRHPQWQTPTDDRPAKERQEAAAKVLASKPRDVATLNLASVEAPGSEWAALFSA
jgi:hypothetical protein